MNKCINCAYFLNCENANEENTCNKYKFIRKSVKENKSMEEDTKRQIEQLIEIKNIERQIADLFYRMCPNVPPQLLASIVIETINNFRELNKLYSKKVSIKIDGEKIGMLDIPSVIKEQKMYNDNYKNTPKID